MPSPGDTKERNERGFQRHLVIRGMAKIEPGDPEASVLIERVTSDDPDLRMPPPDEHPDPLPPAAIELLERWIAQGAKWGDHWSLAPLVDPVPELADEVDTWLENQKSAPEANSWGVNRPAMKPLRS